MLPGPPAARSTGSPSRRQHKSCRPRRLMSDLCGFQNLSRQLRLPDSLNGSSTALTRTAMQPTFGTLEWGKKNNGVLTRTERVQFLRNMAFLAAREVTDVIRAKLGLLKPVNLDFSDLTPPDTCEYHARTLPRLLPFAAGPVVTRIPHVLLDDAFRKKFDASGRFKIVPIPSDVLQEVAAAPE